MCLCEASTQVLGAACELRLAALNKLSLVPYCLNRVTAVTRHAVSQTMNDNDFKSRGHSHVSDVMVATLIFFPT